MRPFRSFLLLLLFLTCFSGLYLIIPWKTKLPTADIFLPSGFLARLQTLPDTVSLQAVKKPVKDTTVIRSDLFPDTSSSPGIEVKKQADPLGDFIDSLSYSEGQMRIMYYGDSQIEGDRITSFLRRSLRKGRGGTGPGLFLPNMTVMYTESISIRSSNNWKRYNYLSYKSGEISHKNLGPFMAMCRFMSEGDTSAAPQKAFVRISPSVFADSAAAEFDILRIFYGNTHGRVGVTVKAGKRVVLSDILKTGNWANEITCSLEGEKDILIEFEGRVSPDIYGISIESRKGVIVDNIPQRGSAGLEFTMVNKTGLEEIYKMIGPDLFILQFGLNIVKNVRKDYSYYEKGLYRQITLLREICPHTPVLVVGLTDMARSEGDSLHSYPNIAHIRDAQKAAARRAGVAFWDSFEAMGGESSIIRWAGLNPPLAQKDYAHFTHDGADTLSRLMLTALFNVPAGDSLMTAPAREAKDTLAASAMVAASSDSTMNTEEPGRLSLLKDAVFSFDPAKPFIFTTPSFWIFFLFVLGGYSLVYKKLFLRNAYLFIISLFFYYKSGGLFLGLLIFVTVIDYLCGLFIYNSDKRFLKRIFLLVSIISNIGILAYFKYTGFFIQTINEIFGTGFKVYDLLADLSNFYIGTSYNITNIILPVGISFFTFQSLSYTIDVYRGRIGPVKNIVDFGFYVSFFPQLVAGPIVRASEFIPQLYRDFNLTGREFSHSLFLISKGLIKKVIISDFIAVSFIDRIFDAPALYSGFENLLAVYGYGLQIYCDFSGYTDIAIGLALILGFKLPVNFNSPYKAAGLQDFWRRWHISLSRWLKDYLYIPMGGNRKGRLRTVINVMITMFLGGLWHGAALKFIIWGGLHGVGLVIGRMLGIITGERTRKKRFFRALTVIITFHFVTFCWIFFRAADMNAAVLIIRQITENFSPGSYITFLSAYSSVLLLIVTGYFVHFLPERIKESYRGIFIRIPVVAQLAVIMVIAVLLYQMRTTDVMPFIYFRF
jgi:D-alanyl-lipoteichoic acid acyltransferase DltB (MBOAT superfamily)/lysophospholipase L1-like esterase